MKHVGVHRPRMTVLFILSMTFFLDLAGLFILMPILAPLFLNPQSSLLAASDSHLLRTLMIGVMTASYGLGQFFGGPLLGELSDQFGRKKILLWGLLTVVIGDLIGAYGLWANSLVLLFLCRLMTGVASGNGAVLFATAASMTQEESQKSVNIGYVVGGGTLGIIVGPLIGSRLSDPHWVSWFSYSTPFLVLAAAFLLNMLLIWFFLDDKAHYERRPLHFFTGLANSWQAFKRPKLNLALLMYFCFVLSCEAALVSLPILAVEKFGASTSWLGNVFMLQGACSAVGSFVLNKYAGRKLGRYKPYGFAVILLIVALIGLLMTPAAGWIFVVSSLFGLAASIAWPQANALIASVVSPKEQGKILGVAQSLLSLSTVLGPLAVGVIAAVHYNIAVGLSVVFAMLSFVVFLRFCRASA